MGASSSSTVPPVASSCSFWYTSTLATASTMSAVAAMIHLRICVRPIRVAAENDAHAGPHADECGATGDNRRGLHEQGRVQRVIRVPEVAEKRQRANPQQGAMAAGKRHDQNQQR